MHEPPINIYIEKVGGEYYGDSQMKKHSEEKECWTRHNYLVEI